MEARLHEFGRQHPVKFIFTHDIPNGLSIGDGIKECGEYHAVILHDGDFYFDTNPSSEFYNEHRYCIAVEPVSH